MVKKFGDLSRIYAKRRQNAKRREAKKKDDPLADIPYAKMGKKGVLLEFDLTRTKPEKPKEMPNTMYR